MMRRLRDGLNAALRRLPVWPFYRLGALPAAWYFWNGLQGRLGADPVKALEHEYGLIALQFLIAALCVTPLREIAGINLVGGDVVEVSPPFDQSGVTAVAGAHVAHDLICLWAWAKGQG